VNQITSAGASIDVTVQNFATGDNIGAGGIWFVSYTDDATTTVLITIRATADGEPVSTIHSASINLDNFREADGGSAQHTRAYVCYGDITTAQVSIATLDSEVTVAVYADPGDPGTSAGFMEATPSLIVILISLILSYIWMI